LVVDHVGNQNNSVAVSAHPLRKNYSTKLGRGNANQSSIPFTEKEKSNIN
jgi:hypothetical protein